MSKSTEAVFAGNFFMFALDAHPERSPDSKPPAPLRLFLFGEFRIEIDGVQAERLSKPAQSVVASLVLAGSQGVNRPQLASELWPEAGTERALFYLRRALTGVRNALGQERDRLTSQESARLSLDLTGCWCDVQQFRAKASSEDEGKILEAIQIYDGPFLPLLDSAWADAERRDLMETYLRCLEKLAGLYRARGDWEKSAEFARKSLEADPLREQSLGHLMTCLAQVGDFAGMTRHFRAVQERLRDELGLPVSKENLELFQRLLAVAKLKPGVSEEPEQVTIPQDRFSPLPLPSNSILARDEEIESVIALIENHRLVNLTGPGGVGKTRLAVAVAQTARQTQAVHTAFISVARTEDRAILPEQFADALHLHSFAEKPTLKDLAEKARQIKVLIVLDGVEAALPQCQEAIDHLLERCPGIRFLCTSRMRLEHPAEKMVQVTTLPLPPENCADFAIAARSGAFRLLIERASSLTEVATTRESVRALTEICRRLDGLPLALELAATRLASMSEIDLAARMNDVFTALGKRTSGADRQKTLQATIQWSYELLSELERSVFDALAVFPTSWTLGDAESICASTLPPKTDVASVLLRLVDHSLVTFTSGRYRMLDSIRAFALLNLRHEISRLHRLKRAHATHFVHKILIAGTPVDPQDDPNYAEAIDTLIGPSAESHETDEADLKDALRLVNGLFSRRYDANTASTGLRIARRVLDAGKHENSEFLAEALLRTGIAAHHVYQLELSDELLGHAGRVCEDLGLEILAAEALRNRGDVAANMGDLGRAESLLQAALSRCSAWGDELGEATCLRNLGYVARQRGDAELSLNLTEQALERHLNLGDRGGQLWCLGSLAATYLEMGRFDDAERLFLQTLEAQRVNGIRAAEAWNLMMLGETTRRAGRFAEAETYFDLAIKIHEPNEGGDELQRAAPLSGKGEVVRRLGRLAEAQDILEEALGIAKQSGSNNLIVTTLIRLTDLYLDQGDLASAKAHFSLARKEAGPELHPDLVTLLEAHESILENYGRTKDRVRN